MKPLEPGTLTLSGAQNYNTLTTNAALNIGAGAEVTFGDGLAFAGGPEKFGAPALVPEPGSLATLLSGAFMLVLTRFRPRKTT